VRGGREGRRRGGEEGEAQSKREKPERRARGGRYLESERRGAMGEGVGRQGVRWGGGRGKVKDRR